MHNRPGCERFFSSISRYRRMSTSPGIGAPGGGKTGVNGWFGRNMKAFSGVSLHEILAKRLLSGVKYQFVILQVNDHNFELFEKINSQQAVYFLPEALGKVARVHD